MRRRSSKEKRVRKKGSLKGLLHVTKAAHMGMSILQVMDRCFYVGHVRSSLDGARHILMDIRLGTSRGLVVWGGAVSEKKCERDGKVTHVGDNLKAEFGVSTIFG